MRYFLISETEEPGRGETVYGSGDEQDFSVTFGYSDDAAFAPHPKAESSTVYVGGTEAQLYLSSEDGGDKSLLWTAADGTTLWVCSPLPDHEMIQIAESVIVQLNGFTDLIEHKFLDLDAPLLERVEQALTDSFVAQIEDCARRDAQSGIHMSEEFHALWKEQQAQYISPERDGAIARVSALADTLRQEGRNGESIVTLFGPFYTASIHVNKIDDEAYEMLASLDLLGDFLEYYYDTRATIVDERGMEIAGYHVKYGTGMGESYAVPTSEEMQFQYVVRQIYIEAYQKALSTWSKEE